VTRDDSSRQDVWNFRADRGRKWCKCMTATAGADLINRAKNGDRSAFDELVGPLIDHAFRLGYGMLHDRQAAEDAVQEAAVRAWRKLKNLRQPVPNHRSRPMVVGVAC